MKDTGGWKTHYGRHKMDDVSDIISSVKTVFVRYIKI